jgi:hypothetical protein
LTSLKQELSLLPEICDERHHIEAEINELQIKIDFAASRIHDYRQEHLSMESRPKTQVWSADFTGCQTDMSTKFHNCIIVVATAQPLVLSEQLCQFEIRPVKPIMRCSDDVRHPPSLLPIVFFGPPLKRS